MKKLLRKVTALVLAILMLSAQICVLADDTVYVNGTEYQVQITDAPWKISADGAATFTNKGSINTSTTVAVYKLPLPVLGEGQKIGKYVFRFSSEKYSGSNFKVYKMPGDDWNITETTKSTDASIASLYASATRVSALDADVTATAAVYGETTSTSYFYNSADITTYATECYNNQQKYMYVLMTATSQTNVFGAITDTSYKNYDMYMYYYFTPAAADKLVLTESTPSNGSEDAATDSAISFTFNNGIKAAEVTVNGVAAEADISGTKVTVSDCALSQITDYTVNVKATDLYSQSIEETIYFSTKVDTKTTEVIDGESWYVTESATPASLSSTKQKIQNTAFAVYKMALPELGDRKLSSFKFTVGINGGGTVSLLKFMGTDWDMTTMKYDSTTDSAAYAIIEDWKTNKNNSQYNAVEASSSEKLTVYEYLMTADITSYAMECMDAGQKYMYIAAISDSTRNVFGFIADTAVTSNKPYRAKFTYESIIPELRAYNVTAAVSGSSLNALSFNLLTAVDNFADCVEIRDTATSTPVDASLSYDAAARAVSLSTPVALADETEYEVVIKSGTTDNYGNSISADCVITSFTTGRNVVTDAPKIVVSGEEVTDYSSAVHLAQLDDEASYKFVSKISNNTSSDITLMLALVEYNSDNQVTGIAVNNAYSLAASAQDVIVQSASLTLGGSGSYVKTFIWNSTDLKPVADSVKSIIQ